MKGQQSRLFGGAVLLLSCDFRQTLPVIPGATYADEINACTKQSHLWRNVSTLCFNTNIRVQLQNDPLELSFSEQLLNIGNGTIPLHGDARCIKLPGNFCNMVNAKNALIESIFPDLKANYLNHAWLRERAILAAKNIDVDAINFKIQQSLPGNEILFSQGLEFSNLDDETDKPSLKAAPPKDPNVVSSQQEQDDIAKAIELSLKETKGSPRQQASSSSSNNNNNNTSTNAGGAGAGYLSEK